MKQKAEEKLGVLVVCGDRRFWRLQQEAFEKETGLTPQQYWVHCLAGGAPKAFETNDLVLEEHAVHSGAIIMGWGAHGTRCGGYPGLDDETLKQKLDETVKRAKEKFPQAIHYRIWSEGEIPNQKTEIRRVK